MYDHDEVVSSTTILIMILIFVWLGVNPQSPHRALSRYNFKHSHYADRSFSFCFCTQIAAIHSNDWRRTGESVVRGPSVSLIETVRTSEEVNVGAGRSLCDPWGAGVVIAQCSGNLYSLFLMAIVPMRFSLQASCCLTTVCNLATVFGGYEAASAAS